MNLLDESFRLHRKHGAVVKNGQLRCPLCKLEAHLKRGSSLLVQTWTDLKGISVVSMDKLTVQ